MNRSLSAQCTWTREPLLVAIWQSKERSKPSLCRQSIVVSEVPFSNQFRMISLVWGHKHSVYQVLWVRISIWRLMSLNLSEMMTATVPCLLKAAKLQSCSKSWKNVDFDDVRFWFSFVIYDRSIEILKISSKSTDIQEQFAPKILEIEWILKKLLSQGSIDL